MQAFTVQVVVASDLALFREGLRRLLEMDHGFVVVGEAADTSEILRLVRKLKADILVLDWRMPALTVRDVAAAADSTRIILVAASMDRADVQDAIAQGARGLVPPQSRSSVLARAIRSVMGGQYWFGHEGFGDLIRAMRARPQPNDENGHTDRQFGLTTREFDIVSGVAAGQCNKEIAQKLSISEKTVKHHLSNIFAKVGVSSRLELALFAVNHHLSVVDSPTVQQPG